MPNIKSAIKRVRQNEEAHAQNIQLKSAMRSTVKKADQAVANNGDNVQESVKAAIKQLDKAANKGLIHKNKAARKKSSLMKKVQG
ncbi:30S ribosomal protein S20 [Planococcus lenghuensis]|uniref:Small ribosomal subunit protein bS20 n=1 Tax=Planococcus lenghuensis TaxID=2213202 RepID=A0A1Q2KXS7_9BACL|nr:30S ribosomal protein S20 [Planococcus lenghuensis]AQQ52953.1 30S ribosomal protein S20 [Planococcus lenghuensis]